MYKRWVNLSGASGNNPSFYFIAIFTFVWLLSGTGIGRRHECYCRFATVLAQ